VNTIKIKFNLLILTAISMFFSTSVLAEGFNDNYLQLGYSVSDGKLIDKITTVSGSAELGNNYSILGSYFYEEGDWNDPSRQLASEWEYETLKVNNLTIGIGKSFSLDLNTDITSSLMYVDYEKKQTCIKNATWTDSDKDCKSLYSDVTKSNYYTASIGVRRLVASDVEIDLKYTIWRGGNLKPKSNELLVGLMKNITKYGYKWSSKKSSDYLIGGSMLLHKNSEDWTEYGIFIRKNF
jgi:hypothetical protein